MRRFISAILAIATVIVFPCWLFANVTSQPQNTRGLRYPSLAPDNQTVAFSYQGDIWLCAITGGQAQRLTLHHAEDTKPRWSPDGKWLAFNSERSTNPDIWIIPAQGGVPQQITFHSAGDNLCQWSPDGQWLYFESYRSGQEEIWKIPAQGGIPIQVTYDRGTQARVSADGKKLLYSKGGTLPWRKGYTGTGNWNIYQLDIASQTQSQLTQYEGNDIHPHFGKDQSIYYLSEHPHPEKKEFFYNFWKISPDTEEKKQISSFTGDIYDPCYSYDRQQVVFEMDFQLWLFHLETEKATLIPIEIQSDVKGERFKEEIITQGSQMGSWSPDSSQIAFVLDNELWLMPAMGGEATLLLAGEDKKEWPRFSPDGNKIAYCSYRQENNSDIYIYSLKDKTSKQVTQHPRHDFYHSWSPDGEKLLFTSERSGNRDIWQIDLTTNSLQQLTSGSKSEDDASYSPDDKWIAFDSGESGQQEIWIMPSQGNYSEARQLTFHQELSQVPTWSADSRWIAYERNDGKGNVSLWIISAKGGNSMHLISEASLPAWSPDGEFILFESVAGDKKNLSLIKAPQEIRIPRKIPFFASKKVDLAKRRQRTFEEAWRAIEQGFYDESYHGVDWEKMRQKYEPLAQKAKTEQQLHEIINRMVGELKASHTGISRPRQESSEQTGYIGWTLVPSDEQQGLLVKEVLKNSPADKAWIRKGDHILKIGDTPLTASVNIPKLLKNTIDKTLRVYVSPGDTPSKMRYVDLTPVSSGEIQVLRYHEWLSEKIHLTRKLGQGKIIYVHLPEMNQANLQQFREIVQRFYRFAQGMVLDIRNNVGGMIHEQLLEIFSRKPYAMYQSRGGKKLYQPQIFWDKPVVIVINEASYSDAEVFAYAFQKLQLGKIVGTPTPGGVIGTRDITLSDSTTFRVPQVGYYSLDGQNLEGLGAKPDVLVEITEEDKRQERDPQLEKAIEILLQEIAQREQGK